ncbi:MAG: hypothetical protein IK123_06105, partial [Lachnospiraceae bacterium]|nr:hypothetical protein [Lachnospiraceae bacterium]
LKAFIKNNRSHFIDYSEYVTEPPADRGFWGNLIEHMTARAKYRLVKIRAALRDILKGDDSTSLMDDAEDEEEKKVDDIDYFDEEDDAEAISSWLE